MHCGAGQRLAGFLPKMATMLTVHHLETSRSQRILWLLEELGVPYDLKVYARDPRTRLAPAALRKYIATKGSICVDGVSLTVNGIDDEGFEVALIPHTVAHTAFSTTAVGDAVNLEVDLLARYLERLLLGDKAAEGKSAGLNESFLAEHGYLNNGYLKN